MPDFKRDKELAEAWARELLSRPDWVLLDTETTGLWNDAEIIQIGILGPDGEPILDTLCRPAGPIPPGATRIHGITDERVARAPRFEQIYPAFAEVLRGRTLIIYNVGYDRDMIRQTCERYGLAVPEVVDWQCAMLMYAQWYGDWNDYRGNYRWQKLTGGDHSAIGDCRATYRLMQRMAGVGA